ncbi:MAG: hypothetical protein M0Z84_12820 [Gammaproteobacteria bacterium]|nr:hypothetical protein [Gammaproteobacteria bacterium]
MLQQPEAITIARVTPAVAPQVLIISDQQLGAAYIPAADLASPDHYCMYAGTDRPVAGFCIAKLLFRDAFADTHPLFAGYLARCPPRGLGRPAKLGGYPPGIRGPGNHDTPDERLPRAVRKIASLPCSVFRRWIPIPAGFFLTQLRFGHHFIVILVPEYRVRGCSDGRLGLRFAATQVS